MTIFFTSAFNNDPVLVNSTLAQIPGKCDAVPMPSTWKGNLICNCTTPTESSNIRVCFLFPFPREALSHPFLVANASIPKLICSCDSGRQVVVIIQGLAKRILLGCFKLPEKLALSVLSLGRK